MEQRRDEDRPAAVTGAALDAALDLGRSLLGTEAGPPAPSVSEQKQALSQLLIAFPSTDQWIPLTDERLRAMEQAIWGDDLAELLAIRSAFDEVIRRWRAHDTRLQLQRLRLLLTLDAIAVQRRAYWKGIVDADL